MNIIDMHCDTITRLEEIPHNTLKQNNLQLDLLRMKKSSVVMQNFAIFIDQHQFPDTYAAYKHFLKKYQQELLDYADLIQPVLSYQDYLDNQQQGKLSAMLTMEEGTPLAGKLERLHEVYHDGVRMLTLTWNYENELGMPNSHYFDQEKQLIAPKQKGLTTKGIEIVQEMNRLGMIIDVSHASDQVVTDVLTHTKEPFVASHSNARSITFHSRNLPDDLIKKISDRGGVIGINFSENFLRSPHSSQSLIEAISKHAKHIITIGGIDCLGLGSDFDGIQVNDELKDVTRFEAIQQGLEQAGLSTTQIEHIFYRNLEHLYQTVLK